MERLALMFDTRKIRRKAVLKGSCPTTSWIDTIQPDVDHDDERH
ncbi:hypothetical protein NB311A_07138 [Nitrobacter sp. Nb-311A]|nr:hypothetical protein NB311A_07138 [Nitrobacter sp. Nb-311A]